MLPIPLHSGKNLDKKWILLFIRQFSKLKKLPTYWNIRPPLQIFLFLITKPYAIGNARGHCGNPTKWRNPYLILHCKLFQMNGLCTWHCGREKTQLLNIYSTHTQYTILAVNSEWAKLIYTNKHIFSSLPTGYFCGMQF